MKKLFVVCYWLLVSFISVAHPGIGIVKDSKGNIYYTDLKQVWKISVDGTKTKVVSGVHTHELLIDPQDNLYGEHLWYNGETADTWGHYAWCLKNNGELVKDIQPTEGFLTNYSFVRDSAGNMYWVERFTTSRIMKKNKNGEITNLIEGKFGFIGWLFSTKDGIIYFTETNKLHRLLPDGKLETVAENIGSRITDFTVASHNYDSYGIWTDNADNIYLAMIDSRKVIRIGHDGKAETILETNSAWMVCSGIFDNNGNMWVLENSITNDVRARMINRDALAEGKVMGKSADPTLLLLIFVTAVIVVTVLSAIKILMKKKRPAI